MVDLPGRLHWSEDQTMTIDEVIEELRKIKRTKGGNFPVTASWQGQIKALIPQNFEIAMDGECLIIDVEDC